MNQSINHWLLLAALTCSCQPDRGTHCLSQPAAIEENVQGQGIAEEQREEKTESAPVETIASQEAPEEDLSARSEPEPALIELEEVPEEITSPISSVAEEKEPLVEEISSN